MERFWKWLEGDIDKPRTLGSVIKIVFLALVLNLFWYATISYCYWYFFGFHFDNSELTGNKFTVFLNVVICASVIEEMIFRYLPILMIKNFIDSLKTAFLDGGNLPEIAVETLSKEIYKTKINYLLYTGIISSIIFGLIHGSVLNIFIQGAGGMILWFTFLYCSRLGKDLQIGYFGSVLLHASYNFICILPLLLK